MNEDLLALQTKVSTIIYNPFINLKEQATDLKKTLTKLGAPETYIQKLDETITTLDQLESLNHGSVERIKGFNKAKTSILKLIKESDESVK